MWAVAVGHGDGLGASSRQYGFPAHADAELLAAAAAVVTGAKIAVALLPGIGTKRDLEAAREAGASLVRVSTVCTEAGHRHPASRFAARTRDGGPQPPQHGQHRGPKRFAEGGRIVAAAGSQRRVHRRLCGRAASGRRAGRVNALQTCCPTAWRSGSTPITICRWRWPTAVAAIQEGATIVDVTLAGMGAGAGNCQMEPLVAILDRARHRHRRRPVAHPGSRRRICAPGAHAGSDRHRPLHRHARLRRRASELPAAHLRAGERFSVDPRKIIVELGRRQGGRRTGGHDHRRCRRAGGSRGQPCSPSSDDDPTGAQQEAEVPVVVPGQRAAVASRRSAPPPCGSPIDKQPRARAGRRIPRGSRGGEAAVAGLSGADVVLRGDSTLRAHLLEEYRGLRDAAFEGRDTALCSSPRCPRLGGSQSMASTGLIHNGHSMPLDETEYARDVDFSYQRAPRRVGRASARGDSLAAARGCELHLEELREAAGPERWGGAGPGRGESAGRVRARRLRLTRDLDIIAAGLRSAVDAGTPVIIRCAPAFVGRLAHTTAHAWSRHPCAPRPARRLRVVCAGPLAGSCAPCALADPARSSSWIAAGSPAPMPEPQKPWVREES